MNRACKCFTSKLMVMLACEFYTTLKKHLLLLYLVDYTDKLINNALQ